jgi:hypothetical protein
VEAEVVDEVGRGKAAFHSQLGVHFEGGEGGEDGGLVEGLF